MNRPATTGPADDVYAAAPGADEYLERFDAAGAALLDVLAERDPDDPVPFCEGWLLRDLAAHLAQVYRWVAVIVSEARAQRPPAAEFAAMLDPADTPDLARRLRAARDGLLAVLRAAPADLDCWTTWEVAAPAREFWARRMLHETLVHGVDVANAGRSTPAGGEEIDRAVAVDGIDEIVCGFARRYGRTLRSPDPVGLGVTCAATGLRWWARIGPDELTFGRGTAPAGVDVEVTGHPGALLLLLWNRRPYTGLDVRGDPRVLDLWAAGAHL
ncbi:Conserved hypothetical protein CHP03083 [Pseudonocardia dioxanivorans CB1190]|uniref:Mycothiol-dependent maleylpyruvate isomerase metal-binding domain-containing protein n=1 Tax=Pseudonocardia dioxanivorans (strain ATCC 55486 / DSM 44775 / JCM 13855 / CB1190) TaxID=675635 RepID=F4CRM6_PSEUX|nr:maleylpyruvate isomerase family mycothiol-dependent enzyme [Pseudonocardia dioxanivorans]AEA26234.1 Conserved hypothetical protein CHP03083 [Pseudonocardia dioxanivorans CB1190]